MVRNLFFLSFFVFSAQVCVIWSHPSSEESTFSIFGSLLRGRHPFSFFFFYRDLMNLFCDANSSGSRRCLNLYCISSCTCYLLPPTFSTFSFSFFFTCFFLFLGNREHSDSLFFAVKLSHASSFGRWLRDRVENPFVR